MYFSYSCLLSSIAGLVTQTGFVEYISEEHALVLDKLPTKVADLHLPNQVYTVSVDETTALDALKVMREKVHAIPFCANV